MCIRDRNKAAAELDRVSASVASLSLACDDDAAAAHLVAAPPAPVVAAVSRDPPPKKNSLCYVHARYGKDAYRCTAPGSCRMRTVIKPRPASSSASGNGKAGGR